MSNLVIYRKYRPKTFSEVIGQEHVIRTITNAIKENMVSHGYLFAGPHGTGKTTLARLLAKALNCQQRKDGQFEPCNQCDSCLEINQGNAIDLIEIDAASNRGIDEIRELKEGIRFRPAKSKYKVYVIDECLTGDHLISLANGGVKKISELKNGERVISVDLRTGKIIDGEIENWFKRKTPKVLRIKTPQTTLECTPTHKLWIFRKDNFLLTEAKNLKETDFLLSPLFLPHKPQNNLSSEQLSLLALIQCDGHISKDSATIQIEISKDKEYFEDIATKGFQAWKLNDIITIKETSRRTRLIRIYSKILKESFIKLGCPQGKKADRIDIPDKVFYAPLESIKSFIDTCFCCEGDISPFSSHGNMNYRLNFTCGSLLFTEKLQLLLKKFGIGSNILRIKEKRKNHSIMYRLSLSGYNLRLFHQQIGVTIKRKAELIERHLDKKERQDCMPLERIILKKQKEAKIPHSKLMPLGIYPAIGKHLSRKAVEAFIKLGDFNDLNKFLRYRYEQVKKIEIINESKWVYDFTVKGTHNFIVNGICSSNCHQLSKDAANALLKTLEEPPSHAVFILATTESHKMIPTILSRCQTFDFRKLQMPEIIARLEIILKQEKISYEPEVVKLIASQASGAMRDAESLLDEVVSFTGQDGKIELKEVQVLLGLSDRGAIFQFINFLKDKKAKEAIEFIDQLIHKAVDPKEFIRAVIQHLREFLLLKIDIQLQSPLVLSLTSEEKKQFIDLAGGFTEQQIKAILEKFMEAENKMRTATILQLPLELAIVEICLENK